MSARRRLGDQSGATALEFAILAPMLLTFILGLVQLGWALHCGSSVRWALETSSRTILTNPNATQSALRDAMLARLGDVTAANTVAVSLVTDTSDPNAKVKRATATYSYPLSIPFVPSANLNFSATTTVPIP